jgi:hypothetical protein
VNAVVALQRPPPEIRTFASGWAVASQIVTRAAGFRSAQAIAAKKPAAPPPAIMIRSSFMPAATVGRPATVVEN